MASIRMRNGTYQITVVSISMNSSPLNSLTTLEYII